MYSCEVLLPLVSKNSYSSALPSAISVEQPSVETANITVTFSLFTEDSLSNTNSIAKKLKE